MVNGTLKFGLVLVQITTKSDSRYPVMHWPQLQRLHRCSLPTGVPFFTFSLPMALLSNPAEPEGYAALAQYGRGKDGYGIAALPLSYRNLRPGGIRTRDLPLTRRSIRNLRHRPN